MGRKALGNVPITRRISKETAMLLDSLEKKGSDLSKIIDVAFHVYAQLQFPPVTNSEWSKVRYAVYEDLHELLMQGRKDDVKNEQAE